LPVSTKRKTLKKPSKGGIKAVRPKRTITTEHPKRKPGARHLRAVPLGVGLPDIPAMRDELKEMTAILLGREEPPINTGETTLMEVADAYYARAAEMTMLIHEAELDGFVTRGSHEYKFRTGELRTFMEMAKRAADLGSRRLTDAQLRFEQERLGRESRGFKD
jgi:hypothetical protein